MGRTPSSWGRAVSTKSTALSAKWVAGFAPRSDFKPRWPSSMQPFELTLAAAAQQIQAKVLSPVELTESVLARIAAVNPQINAFSNVTAEFGLQGRGARRT